MPKMQGRLPLRKVKIYDNPNINLYYKNRSKLGFLPKLFLYLVLIVIAFLPFWYLNILNVQAVFGLDDLKNVSKISSADLVRQIGIDDTKNPVDLTNNSLKNHSILLNSETGVDCYLDYSDSKMDTQSVIKQDPEGWWIATNCKYTKLQAIQVLRLNETDLSNLKSKINIKNIQNLDGDDTYAIIYTTDNQPAPFRLEKYLKSLTLPVFGDRFYFNTSSAFETKRIGQFTFYLDGDCQNGGDDPCKLWRGDNNTGTIELLKKNVGLTGQGETNELRAGLTLKFAAKQDYFDGVNLILLDQQSQNYRLLRINSAEWKVFEYLDIPPGDSLYSRYYA